MTSIFLEVVVLYGVTIDVLLVFFLIHIFVLIFFRASDFEFPPVFGTEHVNLNIQENEEQE